MPKIAPKAIDKQRGLTHIGVSAVAIVHDGRGRILLQKRGPKARDEHGRWDITGGAIEFGEQAIDTINRELQEELCTTPEEVRFLTAYEAHRRSNGQRTHWIALVHLARVNPKTIKIGEPNKISEIGWFRLDSLPTPMHSQFHKAHKIIEQSGIL